MTVPTRCPEAVLRTLAVAVAITMAAITMAAITLAAITMAAITIGAGSAWADTTTTTAPPTSTPPTTPPHGGGPNPAPPPGSPPPGSTTSSPTPTSTTVPAPTTTVPPQVINALLHGVQGDLAQLDAITGYDQDKGIVTVNQANAASAATAADLAATTEAAQAAAADAARRAVDTSLRRLSGVAVALYVRSDLGASRQPDQTVDDTVNRSVILGILVSHGQETVKTARRQVRAAEALLKDAQHRAAAARDAEDAAHLSLSKSATQLANAKLSAAGRAVKASAGTPLPTILGPSALSAGELAGWFATTSYSANTTVPLPVLAGYYISQGTTDGLRGDIAFAQSIIETGYFTFPTGGQLLGGDNNFAGIGACDTCDHGWRFPDPKTGVEAQLQLLHAYASVTPIPTPLVGRVGVSGCCPTWLALSGVWATATNYGYAILKVYKQMLDWAIPQRLAAAGL